MGLGKKNTPDLMSHPEFKDCWKDAVCVRARAFTLKK